MSHESSHETEEKRSMADQMFDETISGGAMFYCVALLVVMGLVMFGITH